MNFNEMAPRHKRKSVRVGRTRVGKGLFACRNYPANAIVGEITGEIIDDPNYGSNYCFDIGDGLLLEAISPFRFVNHSCEPNCEFDYLECSDQTGEESRKRVFLFAMRDIKKDEEISIDYNWSAAHAIPCRCHAPSCRGWVVSRDSMDDLVDQ